MSESLVGLHCFAEALTLQANDRVCQAGRGATVQEKAAGDWLSALDTELEQHIRQRIALAYPDHGFLDEEGGAVGAQGWATRSMAASISCATCRTARCRCHWYRAVSRWRAVCGGPGARRAVQRGAWSWGALQRTAPASWVDTAPA